MEKDSMEKTQAKDETDRTQTVSVDINGREYTYVMTDDWQVIRKQLLRMGFRVPRPQDWRWNPDLHQNVRAKMAELGTKYSMTLSHGAAVLNCYFPPYTPHIIHLSELGDKSIKECLHDTNIDAPPLMYAIKTGDDSIVRLCLELGADPNARMPDTGITALMFAAAQGETEIMQVLIQNGADVSLRTKKGHYALLYAAAMGKKEAVRILKQAGAKAEKISFTPDIAEGKAPFTEKFSFYLQNSIKFAKSKTFVPIYKRCGMSRQTFSKIMSEDNPDYRPKKNTVFQLAIGMRLTIEQTKDLLESAGYFLLPDDAFDTTVAEFISRMDYDISKIDEVLFERTQKTLRSYK